METLSLGRKKVIMQGLMVFFIMSLGVVCFAQYGGGGGTAMDPYLIETAEHLNNLRLNMTSHFRQEADIDLSPEALAGEDWYNQEQGWLPIGTTGDGGFRGSFDGNGYLIENMRINRPATDNAALFGYTAGATIINVGMINAHVTARSWIGALVGRLDGGIVTHSYHEGGLVEGHSRVGGFVGLGFNGTEMHYCYSTADAIGEENHVASLVGFFSVGCVMTNCYATGNATGLSRVGGLIGKAYLAMGATVGRVENCYSTGWIDSPDATLSGGLMGRTVIAGHVFDCFWNTETSGKNYGGQNIPANFGRTTAQMIQAGTYGEWNFDDDEDGVWAISPPTYPYLRWQEDTPRGFNFPAPFALSAEADADIVSLAWTNPPVGNPISYNIYRDGVIIANVNHPADEYDDETVDNYITYKFSITALYEGDMESAHSNRVSAMPYYFAGGTGIADDPFLIDEVSQLNGVRFLMSSHFEQIQDLDLAEIENWLPIGSNTAQFQGSYDGGGFSISNLTVNRPTTNYVGLFGYVQGTSITGVHLENVNITGNQYVGGLSGYFMNCEVSESSVTGNVTALAATSYCGGLVGYQNQTIINRCFFDGVVRGNNYTGGLTSYKVNAPSVINSSYTSGEVIGNNYVAGLIAWAGSGAGVNNSYSTANIRGGVDVGGLMAYQATACQITNSYSIGHVSATGAAGGLVARGAAAEVTNSYWNTETSGQENSHRGTPKNTAEMLARETYQGWDFANVWGMQDEATYPYLIWQEVPGGQNIPTPVRLSATSGNNVVNLEWQAPFVLIPQRYNIYRNSRLLASVNHPTTEYNDEEAENFVNYQYYVTAVYAEDTESGASNIIYALPFAFAGGTGTEEDPYLVASDQQLNHIRHILNGHFLQIDNIDLGREPWTVGQGWVPIGSDAAGQRFTGTYNGDGHIITGLYLDRFRIANYQGLFGYIQDAELKKIGLEDAHVRGDWYVGGLAAYVVNSTIDSCYVTGEIEGSFYTGGISDYLSNSTVSNCFSAARVRGGHYTGGLVNRTVSNSVISNSYATGSVYGAGNQIGGLVSNNGTNCIIDKCYSTGQVWGIDIYGGLLGVNNGTVTNSYWNVETSAQPTSAGGTGRVTIQMVQQETYQPEDDPDLDWDFDDVWNIDENESYPWLRYQGEAGEHNYPTLVPPSNLVALPGNNQVNLSWNAPVLGEPTHYNIYRGGVQQATIPAILTEFEQAGLENYRSYHYTVTAVYDGVESGPSNEEVVVPFPGFAGGSGTEDDPFLIATAVQFNDIRISDHRRRHFRQVANIDLEAYANWQPLGTSGIEERFTGSYDGGDYTIANLTITGNDMYRGLFGYLENAELRNIGLIDVDITASTYSGGYAGWVNNTTITDCYVTGSISGTGTGIGGLVGYASGGTITITGCWADVEMQNTGSYLGGIVGYATTDVIITNCYSTGELSSTGSYVGGIMGYMTGTNSQISNSYSSADISTTVNYAGGIAGYNNRPIANCYALGAVSGARFIGGLIGQQFGNTVDDCYAAGRISSENELDIGGLLGANTAEVTHSYWDRERAGINESAGGEGRDTRQMVYPYDLNNVFIRWDFEELWVADEGFEPEVNPGVNWGYPYLYWQHIPSLDTPVAAIALNAENNPVISWEAIEGANSYRIYASVDYHADFNEWTHIGSTDELYFADEAAELGRARFYRVIASSQEIDGRRRMAPSPVLPENQDVMRIRRSLIERRR